MLPRHLLPTAADAEERPADTEPRLEDVKSDPDDCIDIGRSTMSLRKVKTWEGQDRSSSNSQRSRPDKSRPGRNTPSPTGSSLSRPNSAPLSRRRKGSPGTGRHGDDIDSAAAGAWDDQQADDTPREHGGRDTPDVALRKRFASLASCMTTGTSGSGSSSGSSSTITQVSFTHGDTLEDGLPLDKLDALAFLDPDSPAVTEESIQRSVAEAAAWRPSGGDAKTTASASPTARSASSSSSDSFHSDASETVPGAETDRSTSPEQESDDGTGTGSPTPKPTPVHATVKPKPSAATRAHRYGTPEMPRGTANLPHRPHGALNPRILNQGYAKHLPRAEKLPLTGYELLASRLSGQGGRAGGRRGSIGASSVRSGWSNSNGGEDGGMPLRPIYRKFEALNHRLLLQLQDELAELEEQLHRLDTADTQNRRTQSGILPASRRAEYLSGGELQWHRTDILGKIGYKLGQYNHVLTSFAETQRLGPPSSHDVETYRAYLSSHQPIAEIETRFLDPIDDLVAVSFSGTARPPSRASSTTSRSSSPSTDDSYRHGNPLLPTSPPPADDDAALTPMPHAGPFVLPPHARRASPASLSRSSSRATTAQRLAPSEDEQPAAPGPRPADELPHLVIAAAVAVLVPVLAFAVVPGFVGRAAVVLLVALAVSGAQVQAGTVAGVEGRRNVVLCAGVYGGVMAVLAGLVA